MRKGIIKFVSDAPIAVSTIPESKYNILVCCTPWVLRSLLIRITNAAIKYTKKYSENNIYNGPVVISGDRKNILLISTREIIRFVKEITQIMAANTQSNVKKKIETFFSLRGNNIAKFSNEATIKAAEKYAALLKKNTRALFFE